MTNINRQISTKVSPRIKKSVQGKFEYYELIGLTKEPFSMAPDPEFFYQTKAHGECLNRLEISLRLTRGLHVVVGDIGTGKTTLSRSLMGRFVDFGKDYKFYLILDPTWTTPRQFLLYLKKMFGIKDRENTLAAIKNQIEHFLMDNALNGAKKIVLIIDEGQKMRSNQIEIIRTLLNFETNDTKLIQVIIFAQPEFQKLLDNVKNFKDRIAFGYILTPLDLKDTVKLIDYRLKISKIDIKKKIFTKSAKELIYEHTKGYPRQIVKMCHNLIIDMLIAERSMVDSTAILSRLRAAELHYV